MPETFNVGAMNQGFQNLGRALFNSGEAATQGARSAGQADLIRKRAVNEELEAEDRRLKLRQAQEADAMVGPMAQSFINFFSPKIPERMVQGDAVPVPVTRAQAFNETIPAEAIGADGDTWAPNMNPDPAIPAAKFIPAIAPQDVDNIIRGTVRLGVNKGDPNVLQNAVYNALAGMLSTTGGEREKFEAAAILGKSTPKDQRYSLEGTEQAELERRAHELSKAEFAAQAKLAATEMMQNFINGRHGASLDLRRYLGDKKDETNRYGIDTRARTSMYNTDQTVAQKREAARERVAQGLTPGSGGRALGVPQTGDEQAKIDYTLEQAIAERTNTDGDVDPAFMRMLRKEYDDLKAKPENRNRSPRTVMDMILDDYDVTATGGGFWAGPAKINGTRKPNSAVAPNAPAPAPAATQPAPAAPAPAPAQGSTTPSAPQTTTSEVPKDVKDPALYAEYARKIDALPLSPEVKAQRKQALKDRINSGVGVGK